jgi:hypothetical protein
MTEEPDEPNPYGVSSDEMEDDEPISPSFMYTPSSMPKSGGTFSEKMYDPINKKIVWVYPLSGNE